jgi:AcrR family transcriptional regulator
MSSPFSFDRQFLEFMEPSKSLRHLSPEKTAAILDGAIKIFLEQGYAGTTMDKIAVAAGVSKPTVYNHFQDKESLFNALMEKLVHEKKWAKIIDDLPELHSQPPEVVLRQLANGMLDSVNDQEKVTFIRLVMGESGRFPEMGKAFIRYMDKPALDALVKYLKSCPNLKLADPEATARMFMGTLIYRLIALEMLHGKDIVPIERDRLVDNLIQMIVK